MADNSEALNQEPNESAEAATERPLSLLDEGLQLYQDAPAEEAAEEAAEPEAEAAEESEEPAAEATGEAEATPEAQEDSGEADEVAISSLQELTEQNEWDPEWVNSLKVPVKVDGETAEATIKDLVASYQMSEAAEKRLEEAKSKVKTLNQEWAEKSEALQGQFAVAAKMVEQVESMLDQESAGIDWKALREDDPAEYSAKKTEIAERRQAIEQMKRSAAEDYRKATENQRNETQQQQRERLKAEHDALLEKIPEWSDQGKAAEEKAKLAKYLTSQGFSENDVMGASDHRLIVLADKARRYDEGKQRTEVAKKKVVTVPKVLKPGTTKPKPKKSEPETAESILYG